MVLFLIVRKYCKRSSNLLLSSVSSFQRLQSDWWIFVLDSLSPLTLKDGVRGSGSSELAIFLPSGAYL